MNYKELSYQITGACYLVGKKLGCGFLEKVYEKCLCYELKQMGLRSEPQKEIRILYDGMDLDLHYFADIVVEGKVIIELKAVSELTDIHRAQIQTLPESNWYGVWYACQFRSKERSDRALCQLCGL